MNINEILDFIKTTELHESWLVEDLRQCTWTKEYDEISWFREGESYSADSTKETIELDNLVFINADTGQGYKLTYVFSRDKFEGRGL